MHAFANDIDLQAIQTFAFNHPEIQAICKDITCFENAEITELASGNRVDLIVGGPPCQGFSIAGQRIANELVEVKKSLGKIKMAI